MLYANLNNQHLMHKPKALLLGHRRINQDEFLNIFIYLMNENQPSTLFERT